MDPASPGEIERPHDRTGRFLDAAVVEQFTELLRRMHLCSPSDVAAVVTEHARRLGARDLDIYLVDYDLTELVPIPKSPADRREPLSVVGTVAGRAYSSVTILESTQREGEGRRIWLPLIDGTERFGAMGVALGPEPLESSRLAVWERYAHLVAMIIATKDAYGDIFEKIRRRRPMTIASELVWSLAPPLVFATDRLVLAGMLEPAYDNGGDALDYAVDDGVLHLGVFDAMGHGLAAAGVAAFAVAAYRHSRRAGRNLMEMYEVMNTAVAEQFPGERYVTAVIAQLDVQTGRLSWISAGHPPPLIIRNGRRTRTLVAPPALPLGIPLPSPAPQVAEESLEPGDLLLLYTDGLTEARRRDGQPFTLDGLSSFIEREAASGHPAPETLRRLRQAIVAEHDGSLRDDATALLIEWNRGSERMLLPPTAEG